MTDPAQRAKSVKVLWGPASGFGEVKDIHCFFLLLPSTKYREPNRLGLSNNTVLYKINKN